MAVLRACLNSIALTKCTGTSSQKTPCGASNRARFFYWGDNWGVVYPKVFTGTDPRYFAFAPGGRSKGASVRDAANLLSLAVADTTVVARRRQT